MKKKTAEISQAITDEVAHLYAELFAAEVSEQQIAEFINLAVRRGINKAHAYAAKGFIGDLR